MFIFVQKYNTRHPATMPIQARFCSNIIIFNGIVAGGTKPESERNLYIAPLNLLAAMPIQARFCRKEVINNAIAARTYDVHQVSLF